MNAPHPLHPVTGLVDDQPHEFRVATAAYRGAAMFAHELEHIFYRTWIFLCHESEVPAPGDFKSTQIGLRPVLVTRDREGTIRAHLNVCTHRGATLSRAETGNTRTFTCPYHGWSFGLNGDLLGIPDEARYPEGFDKSTKGLKSVPRIASYGGFVFGSFNAEVEPLEDFLGGAKRHIDLWLKRAAGGTVRLATSHKYGFDGNWKFQSENVYDGYHVGFVHRSALNTVRKFAGSFQNRAVDQAVRQIGYTRGFAGGHGTLEAGQPLESGGIDEAVRDAYNQRIFDLYGPEEGQQVLNNQHLLIFPNLTLFDYNIRVIQPVAHDRTEIYSYPVLIDGVHDQINTNRMLDAQTRVGTAGILSADDIDVFAGNQNALNTEVFEWITLSRGLGKEDTGPGGETVGTYSDEGPQRAFWRQWQKLMSA